jgi:hypothetical protein
LTEALKDGTETRITCTYKGAGKNAAMSGTYHYKLWVPEGYSADPKKTWKTIFIADPNGKAKLGAMGDAGRIQEWPVGADPRQLPRGP